MPENRPYLPVAGVTLAQLRDTFGAPRSGGRSHKGIDIFAAEGTPVLAVRSGTVIKAGNSKIGGLRVWVRDDQGFRHYYAHMNSIDVKEGQRIEGGQQLGGVGKTGNARTTPPHLHYSVNPTSSASEQGALNPYEYLTGALTSEQRDPLNVRYADSVTGGLSTDPQEIEAQEFVERRRSQSDVMAGIAGFISKAASERGGKVLDTEALFGDFGLDGEEDEHDHDTEEVA